MASNSHSHCHHGWHAVCSHNFYEARVHTVDGKQPALALPLWLACGALAYCFCVRLKASGHTASSR
eukprot:1142965-Pelagomonas_calceolata.AAC.2